MEAPEITTNKLCTSIEQSEKLVEIGLDANTADIYYINGEGKARIGKWNKIQHDSDDVPAWSLSALLGLMPPYYSIYRTRSGDYAGASFLGCEFKISHFDNSIDTAFEMVCWLLENGHIKT